MYGIKKDFAIQDHYWICACILYIFMDILKAYMTLNRDWTFNQTAEDTSNIEQ